MAERPSDARLLIQHLQAENQRLRETVQAQQQVIHQRAEPMALAVLDTLTRWCEWAGTPGHPAQAAAANLLERWVETQERARQTKAGILVVPNLPGNGHGPSA